MNKEVKDLIDKYCMGVQETDAQLDEIMDKAAETGADFNEVSKYIREMRNGPTREERMEAERKAKEEAERRAKVEAERKARERAEREREAREKAEREAKEKAERERIEREEAERKAKEKAERERKKREEAERKAKEKAEREAKEKAERERKARAEAERQAEYERRLREDPAFARAEKKKAEMARKEVERKAKEKAKREKAKLKSIKRAERKEKFKRAMKRVVLPIFIVLLLATGAFFAVKYWDKFSALFGGKSQTEEAVDAPGETFTVNGVSFKMVSVEGGTFEMGSETGDDDEKPVHSKTVGDFMIGETEVTQALWKAVMENNPSEYKGDERPVQNVSWYDCQTFIKRLNKLTGRNFRLPTEAEWEYAARGGHKSKGIYQYSGSHDAKKVAWFDRHRPHEVKKKLPNELGVYDMSGNVQEWCEDWYNEKGYVHQTSSNGEKKVCRGGSYDWGVYHCRISDREYGSPDYGNDSKGLRLVLSSETIEDEEEVNGSLVVKDIDGNLYNTVQIGDQLWMAENLRTTRYADGTEIPVIDIDSISKFYMLPHRYAPTLNTSDEQDTDYAARYGYLYNWKAVMHGENSSNSNPSKVQGICPNGWHVPSEKEWTQLIECRGNLTEYVNNRSVSFTCRIRHIAKPLAATQGWEKSDHSDDPGYNPSTNNETGFSALPTGFFKVDFSNPSKADFQDFGRVAAFWSATESAYSNSAHSMLLYYNSDHVYLDGICDEGSYLSVRCVRND